MFGNKLWLLVSLMLVLAGCGGSSRAPQYAKGAQGAPKTQAPDAAQAGRYGSGGEATAAQTISPPPPASPASTPAANVPADSPASPASASADYGAAGGTRVQSESERRSRPSEPRPDTRPGLGTEWGESRTSRVHDVTFVRDSRRPFAVATLNYNDQRGVEALAAREARRDSFRSIDIGGGAVSVSIRDDGGNPLAALRVGGKTFVIGQAGQRYSIVLSNHTSHRFEAVATVDGLDVINGKDGSFDNRGYVLMPYATLEIDGFRQSSSSVAAFRFASVADSYAAQMGKARNVGVIGVAFFAERGDSFIPESELRTRETASPFPADPRYAPPPPGR